jgi:hypothetical protein
VPEHIVVAEDDIDTLAVEYGFTVIAKEAAAVVLQAFNAFTETVPLAVPTLRTSKLVPAPEVIEALAGNVQTYPVALDTEGTEYVTPEALVQTDALPEIVPIAPTPVQLVAQAALIWAITGKRSQGEPVWIFQL